MRHKMKSAVLAMVISAATVWAESYEDVITTAFLQETFVFQKGEALKLAECKKKSYPTCIYIWGKPSKKDAMRKQYGLDPEGNKLMVIYAQARSQKDFERVLKSYTDAVPLEGLGKKAVWSKRRGQLSLITDKSLVIHVNVDGTQSNEPLKKAKTVATEVLTNL